MISIHSKGKGALLAPLVLLEVRPAVLVVGLWWCVVPPWSEQGAPLLCRLWAHFATSQY